jgi:hypothetical protein
MPPPTTAIRGGRELGGESDEVGKGVEAIGAGEK